MILEKDIFLQKDFFKKKPQVTIASAGPGDPELITLKTFYRLKNSEIILTDRLVNYNIFKKYTNKFVKIIYVGKKGKDKKSTSQKKINKLMIYYAMSGKFVLRLKGGDVSIFSNILDELYFLTKYNISYEIIPGVTAALGAAAYSGIPLTARKYSSSIRFITCHNFLKINELKWKELSKTEDTLVFYMTGKKINFIIKKFIFYKISKEKLMAIIWQATTPMQKIKIFNIYKYKYKNIFFSPIIIIIGKVVSLHKKFKWFKEKKNKIPFF